MAEREAADATEETQSEETAGGGKKKLVLMAIALVVLLGGGAGTFFVVSGGGGAASAEPEARAEADSGGDAAAAVDDSGSGASEFFSLEPFVVNIKDGKRDRYLKLKPDLELTTKAAAEQLTQRLPMVKDVVITLLSSKTFDELRTIEGKDLLREEMMTRLNAQLSGGKVSAIYFTDFIIQ